MPTLDELGGWPVVLGQLTARRDLSSDEARAAMTAILDGTTTPAQIAGFIVALRMKGETVEELIGLVAAMVDAAEPVDLSAVSGPVVDIVGTGGDRAHTINVSTLSSFVVAGAGVKVCKHGNRAASSSCGAADLLEALGVTIDVGPDVVARCVVDAGMGFCFAPRFHPSMRHAGPPRRELGVPTVFNVLGPLAHPGRVRRQLVGVADGAMAERMAKVFAATGSERTLLVHGDDGLDEITTCATTTVTELRDGEVRTWTLDPGEFGIGTVSREALVGGDPAANADLARRVLAGEAGPHRDIVLLNAAAGLLVAGAVDDLAAGVAGAAASIDEGRAADVVDRLVACTSQAG